MKPILAAIGLVALHAASQAGEIVICPERVELSSATLQLDGLTPGFEAFPRLGVAHLESAGLYSGPPSLLAQLRPGKSKPGALASWELYRIDPSNTKVDPRMLDFWVVCSYSRSSVDVAKKLENTALTQCSLKEIKNREKRKTNAPRDTTIRLGFYCE